MTLIGILGAGGQARETADFASGASISFFAVDERFLPANGRFGGITAIDIEHPGTRARATAVAAAVGAPGLRRDLVRRWPGVRYATVVAEHAYVARDVRIGEGCMVAPGAILMAGAGLGRHVLVNAGATIGHDTVVDDYGTISPGAHIGGSCRIGQGAFLGIGATVLHGVEIGDGAVLGAGAVAREDLQAHGVYIGVPARRIRSSEGWLYEI